MALRLKFQITMLLASFKNLKLCNQGRYWVKIQLYTQTKLAKYFATMTNKDTAFGPYTIYKPCEEPQTKSREIENKNILKFETGKLNIRFVEEEIFINEIVKFSHEIDIPKSESQNLLNLQAPLMLKAVLYHSRFSDSNEK